MKHSPWFAPRATRQFTRGWFRRGRRSGVFFSGGCVFWLCVLYIWIALWLTQAALWLAVVALIWTAQLAVLVVYLPAVAVSRLARLATRRQLSP